MDPDDASEGPEPEDEFPDVSAFREFRDPLPPDDRLWRHPSELAAVGLPSAAQPRSRGSAAGWSAPLVSGLIGSVLTFGLVAATGALSGDTATREVLVREQVRPARVALDATADGDGVVRIAEELSPAITRIVVTGDEPGSGSGVLFRDNGYVLTNSHVVDDADRITVVLADGEELRASLVGADPDTDIAVVKIDGEGPFPTAVLGSAEDLQVGEMAIAIGSPLGLIGGSSVTTGVVSALGRRVASEEGPPLLDMIQTDAAIAPGSSGGALCDSTGAVIGITTAIAVSEVGAEGLGFATPIDIARSVADDIIDTGRAIHVWLGIEGSDLGSAAAKRAGVTGGARVERVVDDSPAAGAGLEEDDVILAVSGRPVRSMTALVIALRALDPGDRVEIEFLRDGEERRMWVVLGQRPDDV